MKTPNPPVSLKEDNTFQYPSEMEPDYSNADVFFAFIDVLGFKQSFDEHRENASKITDNGFAEKYRKIFGYYFQLVQASGFLNETNKQTECYAGQTSDTLYFYSPRSDFLVQYIKIFLHLNLYAMSQDVFFRGGIARGNLFVKEPYQFYGESVIYAYLLESGISKYPIVVIDEDTYQAIKNDDKDCKDVALISTDDKTRRHYLNIFAPLEEGFSLDLRTGVGIEREINFSQVKANIEKNKRKFEYDAKNYEKYSFLLEKVINQTSMEQAVNTQH